MHAIATLKLRLANILWPEYQPRARKQRSAFQRAAGAPRDMPIAIVVGERFSAVMHAALTTNNRPDLDEAIACVDAAIALVELARKHERGIAMTQEERAIATAVHHVIQHYVEA